MRSVLHSERAVSDPEASECRGLRIASRQLGRLDVTRITTIMYISWNLICRIMHHYHTERAQRASVRLVASRD